MKHLTLLHLNIERDYHLDKIEQLIHEKQPDILCFQEIFDSTIETLRKEFPHYMSVPRLYINNGKEKYSDGVVVMSKYPILSKKAVVYGNTDETPTFENEDIFFFKNNMRPIESFNLFYAIACIEIEINGTPLTIGTTHFPAVDRASRGRFDNVYEQSPEFNYFLGIREIYESFLRNMKSIPGPFIFTADMNNDRSEYMYQRLSQELIDHVPRELISTIDPDLHKIKGLSLMIDTIMSTPEINVHNFEVIQGVSDHKAFVIKFSVKNNVTNS